MSKRNVAKNLINTTFNYNQKKSYAISQNYTTKTETVSQKDINLKKFYLPSIRASPHFQNSSIKLVKSQSQGNLDISKDDTKPGYVKQNQEKEKLMFAKLDLCRIESKISDINFNCKKLIAQKEENLKIIKEVINSNNMPEKENLITKIQIILEDTLKNNNYKKTIFSTENYESHENTLEEKNSKNEDLKIKNNRYNKKREGSGKIRIRVSRINALNDKNNMNEKEIKVDELNNAIINEENKEENEENKNNEENNNNKENNIIHIKGMIEEIKNDENHEINNIDSKNKKTYDLNQETSNLPDFSADNMIKINAISANNSNFNNINNSLDEQMNLKEIIEEEKDEDFNKNSEFFNKSVVPKKVYNKAKIQSKLSILKHRLIDIQQKIKLKEEEIEEIKNKACLKNLIFQSNLLNTKMVKLHKIKTKNDKYEKFSIPQKSIHRGNLKNELDYYTKKNKSFISENKTAEKSYYKVINEFKENNKTFAQLEMKNDRLKYKFNSLRLKDVKKQIDLDNLKKKINQIEDMKFMLENNKKIRDEKSKEIEETKKILEEKTQKYERTKENANKKYQEMNKFKKELNIKKNRLKNIIIKLQKEIKEIDKNILVKIDQYQHLTKNDEKIINMNYIYKTKTHDDFLNFLKELEEESNKTYEEKRPTRFENLQKGGKMKYFRISKIKNKIIKMEEIKLEDNSPELEQKQENYINSEGELILKNDEKEDENAKNKTFL